jgi:hypothetical protein
MTIHYRVPAAQAAVKRTATTAKKINPLEAFAARAAIRAQQWHLDKIASLHAAVDALEADARRAGIDVDVAQAIMSDAFLPFRRRR